jgi:hypothetical protein
MSDHDAGIFGDTPSSDTDDSLELGSHTMADSRLDVFCPARLNLTPGPDGIPDLQDLSAYDEQALPLTPQNLVCLAQEDGTPACEHYHRQLYRSPQIPGINIVQRWCTHGAMRGLNGAALSLSDESMFACTLRSPRHAASEKQVDDGDAEKLKISLNRKAFRMCRTPEDVAAGRFMVPEEEGISIPPVR